MGSERVLITIAADGPGSAGKTIARGVAQHLGYQYIDTGAMYRSVALFAAKHAISLDDGPALKALIATLNFQFTWEEGALRVVVNGQDVTSPIRDEKIGLGASRVSKLSDVRDGLLDLQRSLVRMAVSLWTAGTSVPWSFRTQT